MDLASTALQALPILVFVAGTVFALRLRDTHGRRATYACLGAALLALQSILQLLWIQFAIPALFGPGGRDMAIAAWAPLGFQLLSALLIIAAVAMFALGALTRPAKTQPPAPGSPYGVGTPSPPFGTPYPEQRGRS